MAYKKSTWVPYDPTLSFEQNVANGGTTTADKLNNMETGIGNSFDKTSDTVGIRNYVLNTENPYVAQGTGADISQFLIYSINQDIPITDDLIISFDLNVVNPDSGTFQMQFDGNNDKNWGYICGYSSGVSLASGHYVYHFGYKNATIFINNGIYFYLLNTEATVTISNLSVYSGDANANWVPAPEDKVNTSDMRKPASDVVGLEDVPDSMYRGGLANGTDLDTITEPGIYSMSNVSLVNYIDKNAHLGFLKVEKGDVIVSQTVIDNYTSHSITFRKANGTGSSLWTSWLTVADNATVLHRTDEIGTNLSNGTDLYTLLNTSGISLNYYITTNASAITMLNCPTTNAFHLTTREISGNETSRYNYTQMTINDIGGNVYQASIMGNSSGVISVTTPWYKIADDSKVAHLSGANNFDTVPTVNNKSMATTDDVTTASNTVLTSANTSISKLLQQSSSNDEASATTDSTSDTSNFYYWTE